jgi:hypothetical protein
MSCSFWARIGWQRAAVSYQERAMVSRYMVGTRAGGKSASVTVEAEDALIAALKVKQRSPAAMITYVRKQNARGDRRHPHLDVARDDEG